MNLLEATESTDRLAPVSETTADDFERAGYGALQGRP